MSNLLPYLAEQPENIEPYELCHFDCLVTDDDGEPVDDPSVADLAAALDDTLACWDASLAVNLSEHRAAVNAAADEAALWDAFDAAVREVALDGRYSVYEGDGFVEVYRIEDVQAA